jgi:hypothetical protein
VAWLDQQQTFAELQAAHRLAAANPVPATAGDEPNQSNGSTAALVDEDEAEQRSAF